MKVNGAYYPHTLEETRLCIAECPPFTVVITNEVFVDLAQRVMLLENLVAEALPGLRV